MSKNVRKRRDKLWTEKHGKCFWCGINTILPHKGENRNQYDANLATLDHLRSRLEMSRHEPNFSNEERTVLSCLLCNHTRGRIAQMLTQNCCLIVKAESLISISGDADNTV
jgi:hypothetical protein